jgi:hypothetical protein
LDDGFFRGLPHLDLAVLEQLLGIAGRLHALLLLDGTALDGDMLLAQGHLLLDGDFADIGAHPGAAAGHLALADAQFLLDDRDMLLLDDIAAALEAAPGSRLRAGGLANGLARGLAGGLAGDWRSRAPSLPSASSAGAPRGRRSRIPRAG